jgi:hypothetical protein
MSAMPLKSKLGISALGDLMLIRAYKRSAADSIDLSVEAPNQVNFRGTPNLAPFGNLSFSMILLAIISGKHN